MLNRISNISVKEGKARSKNGKWPLFFLMVLLGIAALMLSSCKKKSEPTPPSDVWDIDQQGIPRFMAFNYIELSKIARISKFRSSVGHDYSDAFEHCRSMKHYFEPLASTDWSAVRIVAPTGGVLTRVEAEWAGVKIEMVSDDYPAFRFSIFHLNPLKTYQVGDHFNAGELLGYHIGSQTMSDISVIVNDPTRSGRMVSYFDVISDGVFAEYLSRGSFARSSYVISKELRDANPLQCSGDTFISSDTLQNWVVFP